MTAIASLAVILVLGGLSTWNLCSRLLEDRKGRKQKRVSTAIRLLPWLYEVRSRHQHLSWETRRGLDIDLMLRNPWQFQEAFRLPGLTDADALEDLWALPAAPFSHVTQLLMAVCGYNALVDSAPLCQQRENASRAGRYGGEIPPRLQAIGQHLICAMREIENILAPSGVDPERPSPDQRKSTQQPEAVCTVAVSDIQTGATMVRCAETFLGHTQAGL